MWPWEHVAVAYVLVSAWCRARGTRPGPWVALAAAGGALFPDLVDKPLGWTVGLLPGGTSLAHSLLFCVPLLLAGLPAATAAGRRREWGAFAAGYLAHLPADVLYGPLVGRPTDPGFLLWPLVPVDPVPPRGALTYASEYFAWFVAFLSTPRGAAYAALDALLLALAVGLWLADGRPGLPRPRPRTERS